jgi:hypothetical protein
MPGMEEQRRARLRAAVVSHSEGPGWLARVSGVVVVAVATVPGVDGAAVSLRAEPRSEALLAASDDWAAELEQLQYARGEGPAVEAQATGMLVAVSDLVAEQLRWPMFAHAATQLGAAAVWSYPLRWGGIRLGALDLFGRTPYVPDREALADGATLADLARDAVLDRAAVAENPDEDWLAEADSYRDVNIATGMLAAQLGISLADAFARLRAHAFAVDRPLLEVAADVLARRLPLDQLRD